MTTHVTQDGRTFVRIGAEPYRRKDGSMTMLDVWQGTCRVCGAPYTVRTPEGQPEASKSFGVVHCRDHRLSQREATSRDARTHETHDSFRFGPVTAHEMHERSKDLVHSCMTHVHGEPTHD